MHTQTLSRLLLWLIAAIVVLSGLSLTADNWLWPHWDASQGAWVTSTSDAYWDNSMGRWQADKSAMFWNEERGVWMYQNGVYWDDSRGVWLDKFGDHIDAQLNVWVSAAGDAYWDSVRREWRPLVIAQ
ncbi:MAG: hypothetical protein AAB927_02770 [Patescibacteria group bacterium]